MLMLVLASQPLHKGQQLLLWRDTVGGHQPCFYCPVVGPYLQGYSVDCSTVEEKSNFIAGDWLLKKNIDWFHSDIALFGLTITLSLAAMCRRHDYKTCKCLWSQILDIEAAHTNKQNVGDHLFLFHQVLIAVVCLVNLSWLLQVRAMTAALQSPEKRPHNVGWLIVQVCTG